MILKNEVEALFSDAVVGHITTKNYVQTCKYTPLVRIPICYLCKPFIPNNDVSNVKAV